MVSDRRTRIDWAHCIKDLVDVHYPDAEQIVLVQDNLNTHTPASLYEAFPPAEAKRLADKLEIHYTPKHGSWLNMAEIELSILAGQCLDRRLADRATLEREVAAWAGGAQRRRSRTVDWRFTTADARIKLKHLYPTTHDVTNHGVEAGRPIGEVAALLRCAGPGHAEAAILVLDQIANASSSNSSQRTWSEERSTDGSGERFSWPESPRSDGPSGERNCETARAVWRDRCQDRHWYRGMTPNATDALMGCLGTELSAVVPAPAWRPATLA